MFGTHTAPIVDLSTYKLKKLYTGKIIPGEYSTN